MNFRLKQKRIKLISREVQVNFGDNSLPRMFRDLLLQLICAQHLSVETFSRPSAVRENNIIKGGQRRIQNPVKHLRWSRVCNYDSINICMENFQKSHFVLIEIEANAIFCDMCISFEIFFNKINVSKL